MTATLASSPWPALGAYPVPLRPWRFAKELRAAGDGLVPTLSGIGAVSLAISLLFWSHGVSMVSPFAAAAPEDSVLELK